MFQKKWHGIIRKRCVKHDKHKENKRLHTKFTKLQVLCILSFLQTGLGGENSTGVEPQAVSEGGKKRTHSEPNEQQSNKSKPKPQNLILFCRLGVKKVSCLIDCIRSRFSKRLHFDCTSTSLRFHFDFTSTSLRLHFDVTSISLRLHFDFTSASVGFDFDSTPTSLRLHLCKA